MLLALEPFPVQLGNGGKDTAKIYPVSADETVPLELLAFLCDEVNLEIVRGQTSPITEPMDINGFKNYFFDNVAGVMLIGEAPNVASHGRQWERECLGAFHIKPNFPGRSSHICTGEFIVNAGIRGKGIGQILLTCYMEWASKLGYQYSMFNLVYETNVPARKILEYAKYQKLGRIKDAALLKDHSSLVDAVIYGRALDSVEETGADNNTRFERIRTYLLRGEYPSSSSKSEKSRLRTAARNYRLVGDRLFLQNREVIIDPVRQLQIASQYHREGHSGINRTTTLISKDYFWTGIKDTCGMVIRNCSECRQASGANETDVPRIPVPVSVPVPVSIPGSGVEVGLTMQNHDSRNDMNIIRMYPDELLSMPTDQRLRPADLPIATDVSMISAPQAQNGLNGLNGLNGHNMHNGLNAQNGQNGHNVQAAHNELIESLSRATENEYLY